jgi:peptidyl-prolyl cis-trans isomerase C
MRIVKFSAALLTAALFLSLTACNEKPGSKVLAKVNGTPLTAEDVNFRLQEAHGKTPQTGNKSIDDIINQELLFQKGKQLGLDQDPTFQSKLVALKKMPAGALRLEMARRVFNTQIASKIAVSHQDGKDYYEKNAEQISTELHLQMIMFQDKAKAEEALKKLRGGADFATIARPVMTGQPVPGREPWDLGFIRWDQVPVDFVSEIYRLKPGEISGILGSQPTGFQVVKLLERRQVPKSSYENQSASIINRLRDLKLLQAYKDYLVTLRKEAKIVTF